MNVEFSCARRLVTKFCERPKSFGNEIKIAKQLLLKSPDIDAWDSLSLPYKINSLSFFLTSEGSLFIPQSQKNPYLLDLDKLQSKSKKNIDFTADN